MGYKMHLDKLQLDQTVYDYLMAIEQGGVTGGGGRGHVVSEQFDQLTLKEKVQLMLSQSCAISQANYQKFAQTIQANNNILSNIHLSIQGAFQQITNQPSISELLSNIENRSNTLKESS